MHELQLTIFFYKLVKFIVVSTHKKRWVCKGMKENLLQRLKHSYLNGGEELEGEPPVEHGVAGLGYFGRARNVSTNQAFCEEREDELLEWEQIAGTAIFRDLCIYRVPHCGKVGRELRYPYLGASFQGVHGKVLDL